MSIEVGDAVLKFLGDTSNMDAAFATVGAKAKAGFAPATDVIKGVGDAADDAGDSINKIPAIPEPVPDSAKKTSRALYEARGEARLLGEELGIRLPRHVSNFVAELPGVGEAMSAAFTATAVLVLIKALAEGAEKLSNWIGSTYIFTQAMKDNYAALVKENDEIVNQNKLFDDTKEKLEALNETPMEKLQAQLKAANDELQKMSTLDESENVNEKRIKAQKELILLIQAQIDKQAQADNEAANAKILGSLQKEIALRKQLANVQVMAAEAVNGLSKENADEIRYQISIRALQAQAAAEAKYGKDSVDKVRDINAQIEALQVEHTLKTTEELDKQKEALQTTLDDMQRDVKASDGVEIITPANVQKILQGIAAVKSLGITLRSELVQQLNEAKLAEDEFAASGIKDAVALKALQEDVKKAQQALDDYGVTMDRTKAKSELTWKSIIQDWHNGANATHAAGELAGQAFNQVSTAMTSAFTAAILGQKNWGAALEQATKQAIASLAAQAMVKALFYGAEGVAALAESLMGNPSAGAAATQYFLAAAEMGGIGGVAAGVARAIPGGGGGSSTPSNFQGFGGGGSNTGGSQRSGVSVRAFADGGLVSSPTLALIGEAGREAVIPLDNPSAKRQMGDAGVGGGITVHVHGHVIGANDVAHLVGQINKRVRRGQANLESSSSLRLNKRSA